MVWRIFMTFTFGIMTIHLTNEGVAHAATFATHHADLCGYEVAQSVEPPHIRL